MNVCTSSTFNTYYPRVYESVCWLATILLVGYSIVVYLQNCDVSRISERKFNSTSKDIYPSISLCFGNVLDKESLKFHGINETSYRRFLIGNEWNETFPEINFDEVSIDLEYYLLGIEVYREGYNRDALKEDYLLFDNTQQHNERVQEKLGWKPKLYQDAAPYWGMIQKCMTLHIRELPPRTLSWVTMAMSKSVFQNENRPGAPIYSKDAFSVELHYPGQRYRFVQRKPSWNEKEPQSTSMTSYGMTFRINDVTVMEQRNTRNNPCNESVFEEDEVLKTNLIREMNCTPPYWFKSEEGKVSRCSSYDKLKKFYNLEIEKYIAPCRRVNRINYVFSEAADSYMDTRLGISSLKNRRNKPGNLVKNLSLDTFYVGVKFTTGTYNEIFLTRQFDMQNLIGNAGGYVGICVGYSFLQFPLLIANIASRIKVYVLNERVQ